MHSKDIRKAGVPLGDAKKVLVMLHGRGASAEDILGLSAHLHVEGFTLLAPQAANHTWYPYSFLSPVANNEPWLSSALELLKEVKDDILAKGVSEENIFFAGFSQGACLVLEFVMRHAARYGGVVAFTGGVIGDKINNELYTGSFAGMPVFLGTSNPDPHVPVERVYATANLMRNMQASVTEKVYENMGHMINTDEIEIANGVVLGDGFLRFYFTQRREYRFTQRRKV